MHLFLISFSFDLSLDDRLHVCTANVFMHICLYYSLFRTAWAASFWPKIYVYMLLLFDARNIMNNVPTLWMDNTINWQSLKRNKLTFSFIFCSAQTLNQCNGKWMNEWIQKKGAKERQSKEDTTLPLQWQRSLNVH